MLILLRKDRCRIPSMISGMNTIRENVRSNHDMIILLINSRRMIWEKDVSVLVMITNIKERGRVRLDLYTSSYTSISMLKYFQVKCDLYWPQEGTEIYGTIQVTLISTISFAYYVKRIFAIRCKANRKVMSNEQVTSVACQCSNILMFNVHSFVTCVFYAFSSV
jgi:hypothetical protein